MEKLDWQVGLGDEIKGVALTVERLTERVAALEAKPQPYGLWNLVSTYWSMNSPFDSAGQASDYANRNFCADWRNSWRVYPYPDDGGKPLELREPKLPELWGVWFTNLNRWAGPPAFKAVTLFRSKDEAIEFCKATTHAEPRILPIEELINA